MLEWPFLPSACPSLLLLQVPLCEILLGSMLQSEWQAPCALALRDVMRTEKATPAHMPSTPSSAFLADWGGRPTPYNDGCSGTFWEINYSKLNGISFLGVLIQTLAPGLKSGKPVFYQAPGGQLETW